MPAPLPVSRVAPGAPSTSPASDAAVSFAHGLTQALSKLMPREHKQPLPRSTGDATDCFPPGFQSCSGPLITSLSWNASSSSSPLQLRCANHYPFSNCRIVYDLPSSSVSDLWLFPDPVKTWLLVPSFQLTGKNSSQGCPDPKGNREPPVHCL